MSLEVSIKLSETSEGRVLDLWNMGVLPAMALGALSGLIGTYWDIAWHIDKGRDSFFSPPHNFIYLSLGISLFVSLYALLGDRRETPLHLSIGRLNVHSGVLLMALSSMFVLLFAPADELWHRFFGADVTVWAPMHLIGLMAITMLNFGGLVTAWVERALSKGTARKHLFERVAIFFAVVLLGDLMLLLAEYEYNVPAFPMYWHPLLLAGFPVFVLVLAAKLKPFPWSATWVALLFSALRLFLAGWLMVTAGFGLAGVTRPMIPMLVIAGFAADFMIRCGFPIWFTGLVVGITSVASSYPIILLGSINWYPQAVLIGLPLGLLLAIVMAYMGAGVARVLEPNTNQITTENTL